MKRLALWLAPAISVAACDTGEELVADNVGEPAAREVSGEVEVLVVDRLDGREETHVQLLRGGRRVRVSFEGDPPPLKSGDWLRLEGVTRDSDDGVTAGSGKVVKAGGGCTAIGPQNIAVLVVAPPGVTPAVSTSEVASQFFDPVLRSLDGYWQEASRGLASATGGVFGPYTLDREYACSETEALLQKSIELADGDVYFPDYTRVVVVFPKPSGPCNFIGLATLSCPTITYASDGSFVASKAWLHADSMVNHDLGVSLAAHECGHNLGLGHASGRDFGPGEAVGAPGGGGYSGEYGPYDAVGGVNGQLGHYNAPHQAALGWLDPESITVVESDGTYGLTSFAQPSGVRALKVRRQAGLNEWLWLEWRQPGLVYDRFTVPLNVTPVYDGALIHLEDVKSVSNRSFVLDFTPATQSGWPDGFNDARLAAGSSYFDTHTGLSLAVAANGSELAVTVGYGTPTCVGLAPPTVTLTPATAASAPGTAKTFTVNIRSNDPASCPTQLFFASATVPNGWTASFSPGASIGIPIAPGGTGTATLNVQVPAGAVAGPNAVNATGTRGTTSDSGSAIVAVPSPSPASTVVLSAGASYPVGATAQVQAQVTNLAGQPVKNAWVAFWAVLPDGSYTTKAAKTGGNGRATWNYAVGQAGSHAFVATAAVGGTTSASNTLTITGL